MIFKGRKLKKEEFRDKLAKRLAMSRGLRCSEGHYKRADFLMKEGIYDEYLLTFKKESPKAKKKSEEKG
tara:strand:+ start:1170 stop:1376 length:207 start_codon:yes stop_codon:yes gene_type:complete